MNSSPSPVRSAGRGTSSSTCSWARTPVPAATSPTSGTWRVGRRPAVAPLSGSAVTSIARGLVDPDAGSPASAACGGDCGPSRARPAPRPDRSRGPRADSPGRGSSASMKTEDLLLAIGELLSRSWRPPGRSNRCLGRYHRSVPGVVEHPFDRILDIERMFGHIGSPNIRSSGGWEFSLRFTVTPSPGDFPRHGSSHRPPHRPRTRRRRRPSPHRSGAPVRPPRPAGDRRWQIHHVTTPASVFLPPASGRRCCSLWSWSSGRWPRWSAPGSPARSGEALHTARRCGGRHPPGAARRHAPGRSPRGSIPTQTRETSWIASPR